MTIPRHPVHPFNPCLALAVLTVLLIASPIPADPPDTSARPAEGTPAAMPSLDGHASPFQASAGPCDATAGDAAADDAFNLFPISAVAHRNHRLLRVGDDEAIAGLDETNEKLIYSNTLGTHILTLSSVSSNWPFADDISVNAANNCPLRRYRFTVTGRGNPEGIGGAYDVSFGLYTNCPSVGGTLIPGTDGSILIPKEMADDLVTVEFVTPKEDTVPIPTNLYFRVAFSRPNCAIVSGAPALVGFAGSRLDVPGFSCSNTFGSFPANPYAAFNLEIFGDQTCVDAFVGHRNLAPARSALFSGTNVTIADDYELDVAECQLAPKQACSSRVFFRLEVCGTQARRSRSGRCQPCRDASLC